MTGRDSPTELEALALSKLAAVLGEARARQILRRTLEQGGFRVRTPDDLARLGTMIGALGGIEGALGSMIGVQAAIRGGKSPQA